MIRRHWPALTIAMAVMAAGLNLQAQPATPAATPAPAPAPAVATTTNLKDVVARQSRRCSPTCVGSWRVR